MVFSNFRKFVVHSTLDIYGMWAWSVRAWTALHIQFELMLMPMNANHVCIVSVCTLYANCNQFNAYSHYFSFSPFSCFYLLNSILSDGILCQPTIQPSEPVSQTCTHALAHIQSDGESTVEQFDTSVVHSSQCVHVVWFIEKIYIFSQQMFEGDKFWFGLWAVGWAGCSDRLKWEKYKIENLVLSPATLSHNSQCGSAPAIIYKRSLNVNSLVEKLAVSWRCIASIDAGRINGIVFSVCLCVWWCICVFWLSQ